jgi:hypothetical protein
VGLVEVVVIVDPRQIPSLEERRAAAKAGHGALKGLIGSTEEFLAERREVERRRDESLSRRRGCWTRAQSCAGYAASQVPVEWTKFLLVQNRQSFMQSTCTFLASRVHRDRSRIRRVGVD